MTLRKCGDCGNRSSDRGCPQDRVPSKLSGKMLLRCLVLMVGIASHGCQPSHNPVEPESASVANSPKTDPETLVEQALREFAESKVRWEAGGTFWADRAIHEIYIDRIFAVMTALNDQPQFRRIVTGATVLGDDLMLGIYRDKWEALSNEERQNFVESVVTIWHSLEPESEHDPGAVLLWDQREVFAAGSPEEIRILRPGPEPAE